MDWPTVLLVAAIVVLGVVQAWLGLGTGKPSVQPEDNRRLILQLRSDLNRLKRDVESLRGDVEQLKREAWGGDA
jgi:hypothetical protein